MNWILLLAALISIEAPKTPEQAKQAEIKGFYGLLQITQAVVDDVNTYYDDEIAPLGTRIRVEDCRNEVVARWVCVKYLRHWGNRYLAETGKEPTYEIMARIWNGGPRGWEKKATIPYWERVKVEINKTPKKSWWLW